MTKQKSKIIDLLTGKHSLIINEMSEAYSVQKSRFYRDVYHTIDEEFPDLKLGDINDTHENLGEIMVEVSKNHVVDVAS